MQLIRKFLLAFAALALGAAAATITPASAATITAHNVNLKPSALQMTCPVVAPAACLNPSKGNDAQMRINVPSKLSSASSVELTLYFTGNLVENNEGFMLNLGTTTDVGWSNSTGASADSRVLTLDSNFQTAEVQAFLDGHQTGHIWMSGGAATLDHIVVTITS